MAIRTFEGDLRHAVLDLHVAFHNLISDLPRFRRVLSKIFWYWYFQRLRREFQVHKYGVEVNVLPGEALVLLDDRRRRAVFDQRMFQLDDPLHDQLEHFQHRQPFLRVDHAVVAPFQLPKNLQVLDVQTRKVLKRLGDRRRPDRLGFRGALLGFQGGVLEVDLLGELGHGAGPLAVVGGVRHGALLCPECDCPQAN